MNDPFDNLKSALEDRYAIEREIGRGGMATVYLAEDLKHGRQVAVKVLEPELAASLGADRFLREIETAARLNHPHILPLHDSGEADGFLYYVMPYMEGDSLRDRLDREGQLPVDDAIRIAREVAGGLDYAHEQGVVHRDIKPGNIMLSRGHAVIADFGIARAVDEAGGEQMTKTGISLGSPIYMSPEQASGSAPVDGRADIYALGCVLYEMLAGEPPYSGKTTATIVARKELESAPRLSGVRDTVPPNVDDTVAKSLAKVPADRFATAADFAGALGETSVAPGAAEPGPRRRSVSRTVIAAVFIIAIAATGWLLGPGSRATPDAGADLRSIAVLPFENRSSEEGSEHFTEGVHDDILTQLSKIGSLKVISRTSVMQYASSTKTIEQIAAELDVATVLEGSVQQAGGQVRINVQLIDAATDQHIWAETYDEELSTANLFAIQADVAKTIAAALQATLTAEVASRIDARPTEDLEAYGLYQRGIAFLGQGPGPGFETAADYFRQAVERDSTFALAWVGLAEVYASQAGWDLAPEAEVVPLARAAAERAFELDETLAEVHAALGYIDYLNEDFEGVDRHFKQAIELNPNDARAHAMYGYVISQIGRVDDAYRELRRAYELNPLSESIRRNLVLELLRSFQFNEALALADSTIEISPFSAQGYGMRAIVLAALGRFDEAREAAQRTRELAPTNEWAATSGWVMYFQRDYEAAAREAHSVIEVSPDLDANLLLASVYAETGRYAEALAELELLAGLDTFDPFNIPRHAYVDLERAYTYARSGRSDEALEILADFLELEADPRYGERLDDIARVYVALGDHGTALDFLDEAVEARSLGGWWLKVDPRYDPIRDDPRFEVLLRKAGLT